jgi:hypothetical protein
MQRSQNAILTDFAVTASLPWRCATVVLLRTR